MKKLFFNVYLFALILILSGCSSNPIGKSIANMLQPSTPQQAAAQPQGPPIGLKSMDENDKNKMSHALDNAIGKSSEWTNASTGITYQVTPTQKLAMKNNPYCRRYRVTMTKGTSGKTMEGAACVSPSDSSWEVVN